MIGRKIPSAGKSKSFEYDGEFKMSTRIERQKRARNYATAGCRKIRVGTQLYPVKFIDLKQSRHQNQSSSLPLTRMVLNIHTALTVCMCETGTYPRPEPKVVKQPDPGYDDVFKFFGDLADYYYDEVVFTFGNEPGSIPIDAELSFIPPAVSNVTKGGKAKCSPARG
uniref:uncharacterized protein LOC101296132 n=1 Tax=Fragaria vesca subsp. vesca TaxID=101020 RepID=UPI0005C9AD0B|nr:PREDICTED: uncharacterized protein LOC101296132 [Fragaria vesca subsp. vesca]